MNNLIAVIAILGHLALGAYVFHAFLKYFIPDEYAPVKTPKPNTRKGTPN